jgi:hypothetical protein
MRVIFIIAIVLGTAGAAAAHPLEPSSLAIEERAPGLAIATLQTAAAAGLAPLWPATCAVELASREIDGDDSVERFELACAGRSLAGTELGVDGLAAHDTIVLVTIRLADGAVVREVLGPSRPRFTIPATSAPTHALAAYGRLGIEHLLGGLDHVLFVLGLLFLVRGARARLLTLTAFTVGHSLTLALAVLGVVHVPAAPVEVLIALTLIAVAVQMLEPSPRDGRRTWWVAGGFGLIHGLGFAGALSGAGLRGADLPLALAGFNLGIELGQLVLVGVAAFVGATAARLFRSTAAIEVVSRYVAAYAIGGLAAMWCLERTWAALAG